MQRHYKEKALLATKYKIERLEKEAGFFKRNLVKVFLFGVLFSIWAPTYTDDHGNSILQRLKLPFWESVAVVAMVYLTFCLLGHFVWSYQEKNKMKRLIGKKEKLEEVLKSMGN